MAEHRQVNKEYNIFGNCYTTLKWLKWRIVRFRTTTVDNLLKNDGGDRIQTDAIKKWAPLLKDIFNQVRVFYKAISLADPMDDERTSVWDILHPSKWNSMQEQVHYTKMSDRRQEFPMLPHILVVRGFRGWGAYNMCWAVASKDESCFAVSDITPGCFLGVLPGRIHYGDILSTRGIQGPDGLWLERETRGILGFLEAGNEANVLLAWDTFADACAPSFGMAQVLVFCAKPIVALQLIKHYDPLKDFSN